MKPENRYFDVSPRVVPADRPAVICIRPRFGHVAFPAGARYRITYVPTEQFAALSGWPAKSENLVSPENGALYVEQFFEGEQEHVLYVERVRGDEYEPVLDARIYSVQDDLFFRRPFKGDLHLHSNRSDGVESPAYVAGAGRRIGLDFLAVTDHHLYHPSIEAQEAYAGLPIDLCIFAGEEIHPPDNPVHMINFGGRYSINDLFGSDEYRDGVREIVERQGPLPEGVDPYQYASCCWTFDRVRDAGGLGIFCHPYWFWGHSYTPSGAITSHLLAQQPFDAFELIGGFHLYEADSNTLQVARYHEERAHGRHIPIVGSSDSHGCERDLFGWYYTIAFSPSLDLPDLIQSIKEGYSVAVEALPGEIVRAYGPFRLVKYALFCLRELLPQHDELCWEEGRLMLAHAAGDPTAAGALGQLCGRTAALWDSLWAR